MNIHVIVDTDPSLCSGISERRVDALRRGVTISRHIDGTVEIHRLPTMRGAVSFVSMPDAVMRLHDLADTQAVFADAAGGESTATGRWLLDRVAFLREVARVLVVRCGDLWPRPSALDVLRSIAATVPSGRAGARREARAA